MTDTLLQLNRICKSFDNKQIISPFDLAIHRSELLVLLGPSGCGKTTLLRLIAGLEQAEAGEMQLDGQRIDQLPANRRPVNTVFQHYALFPHLSVAANVAFGLKMQQMPKKERKDRVQQALRLVQMETEAQRKPQQLSGGQQQRVALARAIVKQPKVLLLDEPLSALDLKLRRQMQIELKQLQRRLQMTFILVTHDQQEAFALADRIAVINQGRIEQLDTATAIYQRPANLFVARFVGATNILNGTIQSSAASKQPQLSLDGLPVQIPIPTSLPNNNNGASVKLLLRPEMLQLAVNKSVAADFHQLTGQITDSLYQGATRIFSVQLANGHLLQVSQFATQDTWLQPGTQVTAYWTPGQEVILNDPC